MSRVRPTNLQRLITAELDAAGVEDYRVELGKRHRKLYVNDQMVMVFSNGASVKKDVCKLRSMIRRIQDADHRRAV